MPNYKLQSLHLDVLEAVESPGLVFIVLGACWLTSAVLLLVSRYDLSLDMEDTDQQTKLTLEERKKTIRVKNFPQTCIENFSEASRIKVENASIESMACIVEQTIPIVLQLVVEVEGLRQASR